jgi:glycosyltransferase involved in cell wall biosynthesis
MRPDRGPRRPERRRSEDRPLEESRREPSIENPREPAQIAPGAPSAALTLRSARPAPREREEPRRREPSPARRIETTEPRISAGREKTPVVPEEKGAGAAVALAGKLGISVVIPLYNEQDSLRELTAALKQQCMRLAGPKYEILYINDGSTDRSGEILEDILATSSRVSTISFRRNLGKSAALAAGFAEVQYGIVITMDADLQDDPREFVNLIAKLADGYDLVSGWKKKRQDPMSKTGPSKFFNWVTGMFSGIRLHDFNCGLKAYRKEVTDSLQVYGELHRYLPALAYWQGFRVTEIPVTHHPRKFGKSKFGSSRFFKGFLDLMSIVFTNRYGKRPLHLFGTIGTLMAVAGFVIDIWLTIEWALGLTSLSNRPILLLGLLLILVGVQLISIGLLGEMIVKNSISRASLVYQKEKGRPSAEAQERRASRVARMSRVGGRPRPAGSERRTQSRRA